MVFTQVRERIDMADPNTPTEAGWYWLKNDGWEVVYVSKTTYLPDYTGLAVHALGGDIVIIVPLDQIEGDDRWGPRVLPPKE